MAKFAADPLGCAELQSASSEAASGAESLDLHYPTKGVGHVYDSKSSFWDRRKQDYCNMPDELNWIQAGTLGVRGLPQVARGISKGVPAWLQRWLSRPTLRAEEFHANGEVKYVVYDNGKFVSTIIFRSKKPMSPAQRQVRVDAELRKLEEERAKASGGTLVFRPPTIIE